MMLYTLAIYNLRMCMKEGTPKSITYQGGDHYLCGIGVSFVIWLTVYFYIVISLIVCYQWTLRYNIISQAVFKSVDDRWYIPYLAGRYSASSTECTLQTEHAGTVVKSGEINEHLAFYLYPLTNLDFNVT